MAGTNLDPSVTAAAFIGDITGDVTGDVTGNLTGDVTGDVAGTLTGGVDFPDADPLVAGVWWDNAGTLTKSTGS
jgi:hypothetical protein